MRIAGVGPGTPYPMAVHHPWCPAKRRKLTRESDITQYTWDHRNRLVKVEHRASYAAAVDKVVEYFYDYQNRWVRKALDSDGDGRLDGRRIFLYDVASPLPAVGERSGVRATGSIVMDFWRANSEDMQIGHLRRRYLWGPAVDQILAEEAVDGGTSPAAGLGEKKLDIPAAYLVQWTLTDHLNTLRDIARFDPQTGATTVVNHLVYDAFGKVTSESNPAVNSLFLFTARRFDADTQLQNNLNRWYDASVGRWLSEDPIGYEGGVNLYEYVRGSPHTRTDPTGLENFYVCGQIVAEGPETCRRGCARACGCYHYDIYDLWGRKRSDI